MFGRDTNIPQNLADAGVANKVIEQMSLRVFIPIVDPASTRCY